MLRVLARRRYWLPAGIGMLAAMFSVVLAYIDPGPTDLAQVLFASRALLHGLDPYPLVGPGRAFDWMYGLYYPATAGLIVAPIAFLPRIVAEAVFVGVSIALLAFGLRREGDHRLLLLLAAPVGMAIKFAQWTPAISAAALIPGLAWLWAAKPNFALPFLISRATWRSVAAFGAGCLVFGLIALALAPAWPAEWFRAARHAVYMRPPLLTPYVGPLMLVALWRWRDPDARLLLGLACVPQTVWVYNAVPALLTAHSRSETRVLVVLSWVTAFVQQRAIDRLPGVALKYDAGCAVQVALFYLPALFMVLRRSVPPAAAVHGDCAAVRTVVAQSDPLAGDGVGRLSIAMCRQPRWKRLVP